MNELRYTLVSDGSSDRALIPILDWLLNQQGIAVTQPEWADLRKLPAPPKTLQGRIELAVNLYPCDLLFIHRDAEREPYAARKQEIQSAVEAAQTTPAVCVIPVRMQEAWLLIDEGAIRFAAGNPNSRHTLNLPALKNLLHASGLSGRRLKDFRPHAAAHRVAEFIEDFSPLRQLSAFAALEADIQLTLNERGQC
jgi:hypothetical protein